ncbi:DEKNAAC102055 [Brettanomyces naardenensis]|uniref:DEKNAAC102055 n=1 Tax=Brettanomyces naardenensis TaxID=13370 RepID=A0A448YJM7_BRENA|nr:DEKNAAC102055 [Brettanomyces naardenensis]
MSYYLSNGLRYVRPYYHKYVANAKLRWFDRTCYDVYCSEFRNQPPEHHYAKIVHGQMKLVKNPNSRNHHVVYEGEDLLEKVRIGPGDKIVHFEHVHEPPVLDGVPEIIHEDDQYVVVDKPAGIPVHPVKNYFYNTVLQLVYQMRPDLEPLYPVHRLDRLTSGVLMFGKDRESASRFKRLMKEKKGVEKIYLARVSGDFPMETCSCDDPIVYIYGSRREVKQFDPARTVFTKVFYDPEKDESVLKCRPISGFPHQIRIHLRNLGYPIVRDTLYRHKYTRVFTDRAQVTDEYLSEMYDRSMRERESVADDRKCEQCQTTLYRDPDPQTMSIRLHSLSYSLADGETEWKFETAVPAWAGSELTDVPHSEPPK